MAFSLPGQAMFLVAAEQNVATYSSAVMDRNRLLRIVQEV